MLSPLARVAANRGGAVVMCVGFLWGVLCQQYADAQEGGNSGNSRNVCREWFEPCGIACYRKA